MANNDSSNDRQEEFNISSEELVSKVKSIIREGNARRITIKDKNNNIILSIPLTVGAIGAVLAPMLAAVAAVAALVTECTINVEKKEAEKKD